MVQRNYGGDRHFNVDFRKISESLRAKFLETSSGKTLTYLSERDDPVTADFIAQETDQDASEVPGDLFQLYRGGYVRKDDDDTFRITALGRRLVNI